MTPRSVSILASVLAITHGTWLQGQTMGVPRAFDLTAVNPCSSYEEPLVIGDEAIVVGTPKSKDKNDQRAVLFRVKLDGSTAPEEHIHQLADLPDKVTHRKFFGYHDQLHCLRQSWQKETGVVSLYLEAVSDEPGKLNTPLKIGEVPLDRKSYSGTALEVRPIPSPDGSKLLLYFDGIQSNDIKFAMCWVLDPSLDLLWNSIYRLPVQSLGARTTVHLYNSGAVSVAVNAVVLNDENTKEKRDGSSAAKVDHTYYNALEYTFFALHGDMFGRLDAAAVGMDELMGGQLLHTEEGWSFVVSGLKGKGRDKQKEHLVGNIGEDGVSISGRTPFEQKKVYNVFVEPDGQHVIVTYDQPDVTVTRFDRAGTKLWELTSPYDMYEVNLGSMRTPIDRQFEMIDGRVMHYVKTDRGGLENLREGRLCVDSGRIGKYLPGISVWYDGHRTALCPMPEDAPPEDRVYYSYRPYFTNNGMIYQTAAQKSPSFMFTPFNW